MPTNKSDHVVIQFSIIQEETEQRDEKPKKGRFNYSKTDFWKKNKFSPIFGVG